MPTNKIGEFFFLFFFCLFGSKSQFFVLALVSFSRRYRGLNGWKSILILSKDNWLKSFLCSIYFILEVLFLCVCVCAFNISPNVSLSHGGSHHQQVHPKKHLRKDLWRMSWTSKLPGALILNWKIVPAHVQKEPLGNKLEFPERSFPVAGKGLQGLVMWLMASTSISDFRACHEALWSCLQFENEKLFISSWEARVSRAPAQGGSGLKLFKLVLWWDFTENKITQPCAMEERGDLCPLEAPVQGSLEGLQGTNGMSWWLFTDGNHPGQTFPLSRFTLPGLSLSKASLCFDYSTWHHRKI